MLKRNGQLCEHVVPDYAGRLTDSEFVAYNSAFTAVEDDFKEFSGVTRSLGDLEKSLPQLMGVGGARTADNQTVEGPDGSRWAVLAPLLQMRGGGELMWCSREIAGSREFAVVERYAADSPLAKVQGEFDVQMTDSDAQGLLQKFLGDQREAAQMYADDIVATAREKVEEKYPGQDMSRVVAAVAQRCAKQMSSEQIDANVQGQQQTKGVRV